MRFRVISKWAISIFLMITLFYACVKRDEYPIEPHIAFMSFDKIPHDTTSHADQQGYITLSYTDGDGDLGLTPEQNSGNYLYNIFIKYFEKKKGHFEEVIITSPNPQTGKPDTLWFNGRIPYLTPTGKAKGISGEIFDTLYINNYASPYDTIKFQIYIQDRALHKSNVVETPEIIVKK